MEISDKISFMEGAAAEQAKTRDDLLVIELTIHDIDVARVLIDTGSSVNIIFQETLAKMQIDPSEITEDASPLVGLSGEPTIASGSISFADKAGTVEKLTEFLVVDLPASVSRICLAAELKRKRSDLDTAPKKTKKTITDEDTQDLAELFWQSRRADALEEKREPTCEPVITVCLDEAFPERCVEIGANLREPLKTKLVACLKKNLNTFAWTAEDMPGIDINITCHELNTDPTFKPVKQKRRKLGPERATAVNEEVKKLLKKNGKWRVCVDFTDLNKACPKDSFPLPHIDRLVEATAGNELLSFMDAFSGYNQIMMNPDDREKTAFITDRGTYCYKVMPFGLKNAGATYQRLVNRMFADQLGKTMEVYIDDMLVKSLRSNDHVDHLEECFSRLNSHNMKLNTAKCRFAVASGEFLGYLVTYRGIEANPKQIDALIGMASPKNKREVQRLTGRVAELNRFISRSFLRRPAGKQKI
ncbi:uncharacterized protein LOC130494630 [Raphanus sativus]|uniref:Uncharacterized protein LOC130494630 n=1 Tax=Raphanus sativus TaxID=3726 RepID=A0A9W3DJZ4_RAPSA|nr:uncharacterized protein LOC130494630 [Raphanus sativus]